MRDCGECDVLVSSKFNILNYVDPLQMNEWLLNGLPNDSQSIESAYIMLNNPRWPLIIDTERQVLEFM